MLRKFDKAVGLIDRLTEEKAGLQAKADELAQ